MNCIHDKCALGARWHLNNIISAADSLITSTVQSLQHPLYSWQSTFTPRDVIRPVKGRRPRIFSNNPQNKYIWYGIQFNIDDPGVSAFCVLPAMSWMGGEVSNLHRAQSAMIWHHHKTAHFLFGSEVADHVTWCRGMSFQNPFSHTSKHGTIRTIPAAIIILRTDSYK